MNSSRKTAIIAEGIALYAVVQDMPCSQISGSVAQEKWDAWCRAHPTQYAEFVKKEQYRLFDQVNAFLMV
jgi:hypothetical protein